MGRRLDRLAKHLASDSGCAAAPVDADEAFEVLSASRRRAVIRYMLEHGDRDKFSVSELSEALAAWENGKEVAALTGTERKRVYTALYQVHLPRLDVARVIDYDQKRGSATARPELAAVSQLVGDSLHEPLSEFK